MHFTSQSNSNGISISRVINASSWSTCIAYLEGTGEQINQLAIVGSETSVIIGDVSTDNCYYVTLKDNNTKEKSYFIIFQNNFNNLENWLSQQTGKDVISISLIKKTYVNV